MTSTCKYCGNTLQSNHTSLSQKKKHVQDGSWWCFSGLCGDSATTVEDSSDTNNGLYQRRKTIHFETDVINTVRRKSAKNHSILKTMRGPQEIKYGFLLPPTRTPPKLLLVFTQHDAVVDTQTKAAEKLGFEVTVVGSEDAALEQFQQKSHELVIIDTRSPKSIDYNTLCRSIRNTRGSQHSALVAVVRKSMFEKDDVAIMALLDSGFNRCIVENTNLIWMVNEIIQLKHSDIQPMAQHATCQSVYAALDKCKDVVIITDDSYRCQYANRSCEKYLSIKPDEILGKTLQEQLAYDALQITTMGSSLHRGREWNGALTLKKKSNEPILTSCRAVPISCAGRLPTHFVMVLDTSHSYDAIGQSRGSLPSVRRGSTDVRSVGSDNMRRTSLAKMPLEAPITKLITLIDQAKDTSPANPQLVQLLERVEEILRGPELYAPQVKEDRHEEPIVSELISALLSKQSQPSLALSSRRSSNDSSVYRPSKGGVIKVPAQLKELLDESLSWEFDIFRLEELTKKRPLQYLGMNLFNNFDVAAVLNCDEKVLYNWLIIIEANYHTDNTYHNSTHAADVMQATAGFLEREKLKSIMDPLDEATSLIAAAAHDVDHPGKSNAFLSNSDNPLAILYNDITILESHHAALMFKLTLGDERVNVFKNLDRETYKIARHNVIDMILATEMTKHFEHLAKFVNVFCTKTSNSDIELGDQDFPLLTQPENITLIKRMMIKCSDVSNPTRPLRLCVEWARRIAEEYFQQTDEEKERGLPVVMPMFDRNTCSIPKSQIGFVDYIINDMFEAWNAFIDMPDLITYMRQNYIRWKEFDEQGLNTLADISKLQTSVLMCPMFPLKSSKSN
ncbi:high affinity cAMP-specific and IBMX-insensitive 3',5'-cyclic phosphodiesterase 8 isoform X2 [Tribolium castaneum]|uniref:high affinity cAMP-specific and IBMX-insensitive 3',5'-cyclic phosphodiesterase 8 isoform X2 n=1 Tax=Tribolium castaneum TaxID=7070 RepID=UPI00046BFDBC|nr:PREDICTED: high affinity cAMP-specific and IBMX-insensitive 3',5'-cyclic phosphodiesterase 8A isoform X2 [Tribolium castaneum]|eukprot:XP_008196277.1 PREDICTED: high affinity cAMP-specific and IBMX-insensitive 3',5'-cyclic phosphodiesterase 8A isoform X2 [Tribolium castaneum]